jgi:hypothetical protein
MSLRSAPAAVQLSKEVIFTAFTGPRSPVASALGSR